MCRNSHLRQVKKRRGFFVSKMGILDPFVLHRAFSGSWNDSRSPFVVVSRLSSALCSIAVVSSMAASVYQKDCMRVATENILFYIRDERMLTVIHWLSSFPDTDDISFCFFHRSWLLFRLSCLSASFSCLISYCMTSDRCLHAAHEDKVSRIEKRDEWLETEMKMKGEGILLFPSERQLKEITGGGSRKDVPPIFSTRPVVYCWESEFYGSRELIEQSQWYSYHRRRCVPQKNLALRSMHVMAVTGRRVSPFFTEC
jgi:hypothetical protein